MTMRVLFMQSQSYFGADSRMHIQLMRFFDKRQVEVHVACNSEVGENEKLTAIRHFSQLTDVHVRPTYFGPTVFGRSRLDKVRALGSAHKIPKVLLDLARYIRENDIQIIHGTEKPRDAFYGYLLGKMTGAKSIVHMHVGYGDWQKRSVRHAIRNADGVIGVSNFVAQTVIKSGRTKPTYHIVNGLDLEGSRWQPDIDGAPIRREFGIPEDAPVLGIAARLFYWKGHSFLVDALDIVRRQIPNIKLMIVGEDDKKSHPGNTSFRAELEAQVARLGLQDHVIFTGFRLDVPQVVAAFDIYVMPTWEEPCAVAFIEAMAMAKPVIAWDSGGTPEMVVQGTTGLLTEPRSVPLLADAILSLVKDPVRARAMGQAGRARVLSYLTPQRMCDDAMRIYQSLLGLQEPEQDYYAVTQQRVSASDRAASKT